MQITLVFPAIGHRRGGGNLRLWQMEPLSMAMLAALTPRDVQVRFYDDRLERIPFDQPTELVVMTVETYTARRAYQIASEYRRRRVPVVMGGFHPTLCPDEAARHAEAVVAGEAETLWPEVLADFRHGSLQRLYREKTPAVLNGILPRREIFRGKRYLPLGLVEAGRGCVHHCEFCSIHAMHQGTYRRRPLDVVVSELRALSRHRKRFFFVDDNLTAKPASAKEFLRAILPLNIRWLSQMSIQAAHDEELVDLLKRSGCMGVLIGFESLDPASLSAMRKDFNSNAGGYRPAIENLRRHGIGVYGTFVFGYDHDTPDTIAEALEFAQSQGLYLAAFNHLVPFPGTPVYKRLQIQDRLVQSEWWLSPEYRFNDVAFRPASMSREDLRASCLGARRAFYSPPSIWLRFQLVRRAFTIEEQALFWVLNVMHRSEVRLRNGFPLGDESWQGNLIQVD
jgi:radical SAM superfamily enzyme YgiQ (UPF0313 family)